MPCHLTCHSSEIIREVNTGEQHCSCPLGPLMAIPLKLESRNRVDLYCLRQEIINIQDRQNDTFKFFEFYFILLYLTQMTLRFLLVPSTVTISSKHCMQHAYPHVVLGNGNGHHH